MIKASELKKGRVIIHDGQMYAVKDIQHVAKGNWRSYYQVQLKHFKTGKIIDQRMGVDDRLEDVFVQTKQMEYLYKDGKDYVLADVETYDQVPVTEDVIGDGVKFLKENTRLTCEIIDGLIVNVELPQVVELAVVETPPTIKGATATNQPKEAVLETGAKVRVPSFIDRGEVVRVDTRSGEYLERAK